MSSRWLFLVRENTFAYEEQLKNKKKKNQKQKKNNKTKQNKTKQKTKQPSFVFKK